ncbi:glycosyltransferase family 4 protein [Haliea sp. E1-2-M8]|uniref:MraY family glycosyltransferase n=1 Tax=Haliea sp. E1-2-M8 TaxID=3064706 RepID=UPI002716C0C3|nr:glycosyltransferase family 4 protein [Haliea sp. E1-2-M8]MDO8862268.1 glycosyltransferase family 4 protein [Haliea sp. E1-2-M8]
MMLALLVAPLASALLCGVWLRLAHRGSWLDHPGHRSSHTRVTPNGGGVGIVLALVLSVSVAALGGVSWAAPYPVLLGLALVLMLVGMADDRCNLPAVLRLGVYGLCCAALVRGLEWGMILHPAIPGWLLGPLLVAGMLWLLNLYNFMDGIDGIASLQCILAAASAALLALLAGAPEFALFCALLALCQLGFLYWNWPPARLFMGDAGSIPVGFLLGGLALHGASSGALPLGCWLVLLAGFITDASWTLMARWLRGAPLMEAHREHAYQRLSRHWQSHVAVDFLLVALNALWLFPIAWTIWYWPEFQLLLVILAYLPLLLGMAKLRGLP